MELKARQRTYWSISNQTIVKRNDKNAATTFASISESWYVRVIGEARDLKKRRRESTGSSLESKQKRKEWDTLWDEQTVTIYYII